MTAREAQCLCVILGSSVWSSEVKTVFLTFFSTQKFVELSFMFSTEDLMIFM